MVRLTHLLRVAIEEIVAVLPGQHQQLDVTVRAGPHMERLDDAEKEGKLAQNRRHVGHLQTAKRGVQRRAFFERCAGPVRENGNVLCIDLRTSETVHAPRPRIMLAIADALCSGKVRDGHAAQANFERGVLHRGERRA